MGVEPSKSQLTACLLVVLFLLGKLALQILEVLLLLGKLDLMLPELLLLNLLCGIILHRHLGHHLLVCGRQGLTGGF